MKKNTRYLYLLLFAVHAVIAAVAFQHFWAHPHDVLFSDRGDGLKNIFTLTTYVKEPVSAEGIFKYNKLQYPFGDYVYYTDNNPLFAIPFKWICLHVCDLSSHTMVVLYTILVLNILLCGQLLFYLLRRLIGDNTIAFVLAVILPWINMQVLRIWAGHTAFSFSSIILLSICLMLEWHKYREQRSRQLLVAAGMVLLAFFGFIGQGYYLVIVAAFQSCMLFTYGCYYLRQPSGRFSIAMSVITAIISVCLVMGLLAVTDGYLALRPVNATGYDWMEEKMRLIYFVNHYNFQRFYFFICKGISVTEAEQAGYLGNIALYAMTVTGIVMIVNKQFRAFIKQVQKDFFTDPLKGAVFIGATALMFISFGEHYYTQEPHDNALHIVNVLNILFYIHAFTKRVEQFRGLERFIWPFFFVANIWVAYMLVAIGRQYGKRVSMLIIGGVLLFGVPELLDFVREMRYKTQFKDTFAQQELQKMGPGKINTASYQAVLPIPYYTIGGEDYDHIITDDEAWSRYTFQLAIKTGLPLMANKMSRTPIIYSNMLMNFVGFDSLDARLIARMNDKPVLVAVNQRLLTDKSGEFIPKQGFAAKVYDASLQFALRNHLQAVDSADGVIYYNWYPPKRS